LCAPGGEQGGQNQAARARCLAPLRFSRTGEEGTKGRRHAGTKGEAVWMLKCMAIPLSRDAVDRRRVPLLLAPCRPRARYVRGGAGQGGNRNWDANRARGRPLQGKHWVAARCCFGAPRESGTGRFIAERETGMGTGVDGRDESASGTSLKTGYLPRSLEPRLSPFFQVSTAPGAALTIPSN